MVNLKRSLALCVLVTLLGGCSQQTSEEHFSNAEKLIQQGNLDAAVIELKNALSKDGSDVQARQLLADLYIRQGQGLGARKELERALELGASPVDVMPDLAKVTFYLDDFDSLLLMDADELPADAELAKSQLTLYKAFSQVLLDNQVNVKEAMLKGDDLVFVQALQEFVADRYPAVLEKLSTIDTDNLSGEVGYLSALTYARQNAFDKAAEAYADLVKVVPASYSIQFRYIDNLVRSKDFEGAEKVVDRFLRIQPDSPLANYYKALITMERQEFEPAFTYIQKAINGGLVNNSTNLVAGVSAYKLGHFERSYDYLLQVRGDKNVEKLIATLQLKLGYDTEVYKTLTGIDEFGPQDTPLMNQAGLSLLQGGDLEEAKQLIDMAAQLDPEDQATQLSKGYFQLINDSEAATETFEKLLETDSTLRSGWILLAASHIKKREFQQALDVASRWQVENYIEGKVLEGNIHTLQGQTELALSAYDAALQRSPDHVGAIFYKIRALFNAGQTAQALELSKKLITLTPERAHGYQLLIAIGRETDTMPEVTSYLKDLHKQIGAETSKEFYGLSLYLTGKVEETIKVLESVTKKSAVSYVTLGNAYILFGERSKTVGLYEQWVTNFGNYKLPWKRLIWSFEVNGQIDKAFNATTRALSRFGDDQTLLLQALDYSTRLGMLDKARQYHMELGKQKAEDEERYLKVMAEYLVKAKEFNKASDLAEKLYTSYGGFNNAVVLAKVKLGLGQAKQGGELLLVELDKAEKPGSMMRHIAAEYLKHNGELEKAKTVYLQQIEQFPKDAIALNNLATIYLQQEDFQTALDMSEKAVAASPDSPILSDNLGVALFKLGNLDKAFTVLQSANQKIPNSNDIAMHLAEVSIALGNKTLASELLAKINDADTKSSEQYLKLKKLL